MIPKHRHQQEESSGTDSWLMSYADMITLLMCFFIIFVSVSEPKKDKFAALTKGMADKFGSVDLSTPFRGTLQALTGIVEHHKMFRDIAVDASEQGIEMELSARRFFQDGTAEFRPDIMPVLMELSEALQKIDFEHYHLAIEGYTDDVPFSNPLYPSNWELSSARAAHMVRFFTENGIQPDQLKAVGYGSTKPKVPNLDGAGNPIDENRERNQRIVVRVEKN